MPLDPHPRGFEGKHVLLSNLKYEPAEDVLFPSPQSELCHGSYHHIDRSQNINPSNLPPSCPDINIKKRFPCLISKNKRSSFSLLRLLDHDRDSKNLNSSTKTHNGIASNVTCDELHSLDCVVTPSYQEALCAKNLSYELHHAAFVRSAIPQRYLKKLHMHILTLNNIIPQSRVHRMSIQSPLEPTPPAILPYNFNERRIAANLRPSCRFLTGLGRSLVVNQYRAVIFPERVVPRPNDILQSMDSLRYKWTMDFLPSHLPIPHNSHFPQLPSELIVRRGFLCNSYDELKKGTFTRMSLHNTLTAKQEENVYNVSQLGQPHVVDRLVYSKSKGTMALRLVKICRRFGCPFVPTSLLAVLRHFEQGHWRVFRLDTCNEKNIMASKFLFPGVLDPCASQSRYYCTLCESSYNQLYLLHSHALSTHSINVSPISIPSQNYCAVCGSQQHTLHPKSDMSPADSARLYVYQRPAAARETHPLALFLLLPSRAALFSVMPADDSRHIFLRDLDSRLVPLSCPSYHATYAHLQEKAAHWQLRVNSCISSLYGNMEKLTNQQRLHSIKLAGLIRILVESNKPVLLPPFMQKELSSSYGANYHPLTDKGSINVANAKSTQSSCVSVQSAGSLIIPSKAFSCNQFRPTLTSVTDITGTLANSSNTSLPTIVTSKLANTAGFAPLGPEACLPPISHAETNDALLHRKYYSQYNCAASPKSSSNSLSSELIDLDGIKNLNPTLSKDTTKVQSLVAPRRDYSIDLTCASDDAKELSHNESSDTKIKAIRKEDDASCYSPGQFGKMCVRQNTDNIVKVSMSLSDCSRKSLLDRIRELGSSYVKSTNYRCSLCQDQVPSFWAAHLLHIAHYHSQDCLDSVIDSNIRLPFCCQYCGECFWLRSDLAVHAPVFCQYCPAASQPLCSNTFYLHMLINHLDAFLCDISGEGHCFVCNKSYGDGFSLLIHLHQNHDIWLQEALVLSLNPSSSEFLVKLSRQGLRLFSTRLENSLVSIGNAVKPWPASFTPPLFLLLSTGNFHPARLPDMLKQLSSLPLSHANSSQNDILSMLNSVIGIVQDGQSFNPHKSWSDNHLAVCPVCNKAFFSLLFLDFHVAMTGHNYCCPDCIFTVGEIDLLWNHWRKTHLSSSTNLGWNTMFSFNVDLLDSALILDYRTGSKRVRQELGAPLPSNLPPRTPLYSCTFCPVFCLTLNDLALHLSSAHEGRTEIPLSLDNSEHSSSSPTKVSHIHVTIMKQSAGIQPSFSLKKSNPNMSPISTEYRSLFDDLASVVNAPAANRCSPPQSPVRDFRNCVLASDDVDDDIVCPECDFSSKDRDEVMQHITDTH